jgi:hypothetical protein
MTARALSTNKEAMEILNDIAINEDAVSGLFT